MHHAREQNCGIRIHAFQGNQCLVGTKPSSFQNSAIPIALTLSQKNSHLSSRYTHTGGKNELATFDLTSASEQAFLMQTAKQSLGVVGIENCVENGTIRTSSCTTNENEHAERLYKYLM